MALTPVITEATGNVLAASDWNTYLRDNLNWLIQAGANLASAGTISPTNEFHVVTGTTAISTITVTSPAAGQQIRLLFQSGVQITTGGNIRFPDSDGHYTSPGQIIVFVYDGTNWNGIVNFRRWSRWFDLVNTVTETDMLTGTGISIPGYAIGANGGIRLTVHGTCVQNSGVTRTTPRWKVKLGATTLIDTNVASGTPWSNNAQRGAWKIVVEIFNLSAYNSQSVSFWWQMASTYTATALSITATTGTGGSYIDTSGSMITGAISNNTAVDTTVANALQLTCTLPAASATLDVQEMFGVMELLG